MGKKRARRSQSSILTLWLVLGGVPPVISGIVAGLTPNAYIEFAGAESVFEPMGRVAAWFIISLQGGDAFGAGAMRLVGAVYGNLKVKKLFAAIGIVHCCFELWLLSSSYLHWEKNYPEYDFSALGMLEFWFFFLGHILLLLGFSYGLLVKDAQAEKQNDSSDERK